MISRGLDISFYRLQCPCRCDSGLQQLGGGPPVRHQRARQLWQHRLLPGRHCGHAAVWPCAGRVHVLWQPGQGGRAHNQAQEGRLKLGVKSSSLIPTLQVLASKWGSLHLPCPSACSETGLSWLQATSGSQGRDRALTTRLSKAAWPQAGTWAARGSAGNLREMLKVDSPSTLSSLTLGGAVTGNGAWPHPYTPIIAQ